MICRACAGLDTRRILDLGTVPAADYFPPATAPVRAEEARYPLAMEVCMRCGLAQLVEDDTTSEEPRGIEPQALRDQAAEAVACVDASGWLRGSTVTEFGSPHGGTWLPLLASRGYRPGVPGEPAAVVLDCFGIMHEPDQCAAFLDRAAGTDRDGVLLMQFHSLTAIVQSGQWNCLRHGHFAYYSLTSLIRLLRRVGMGVAAAWEFGLYGGTVLAAAVHGAPAAVDPAVTAILHRERSIHRKALAGCLQRRADAESHELHAWLTSESRAGRRVYAYGAASRATAVFSMAGIDRSLVMAVGDASPAKQNRRMPGTDVPIISPQELVAASPDHVLLTVPDLLPEVRREYPSLDGRWTNGPLVDSLPRVEIPGVV